MFTTSYFSSKAPIARKVCIAKYAPRFWKGPRAPMFAPSNHRAENWQESYLNDLNNRFPQGAGLLEYLNRIEAMTPNPILCCYEADPLQCHRRILAAYISEWLKIDIPEWELHNRLY